MRPFSSRRVPYIECDCCRRPLPRPETLQLACHPLRRVQTAPNSITRDSNSFSVRVPVLLFCLRRRRQSPFRREGLLYGIGLTFDTGGAGRQLAQLVDRAKHHGGRTAREATPSSQTTRSGWSHHRVGCYGSVNALSKQPDGVQDTIIESVKDDSHASAPLPGRQPPGRATRRANKCQRIGGSTVASASDTSHLAGHLPEIHVSVLASGGWFYTDHLCRHTDDTTVPFGARLTEGSVSKPGRVPAVPNG